MNMHMWQRFNGEATAENQWSDVEISDASSWRQSCLLSYQDWSANLLQVQTLLKSGPISEGLEFNMMCDLYFRYQKGLDIGIDGSQGVYELLKTDKRAYPLFKTD
jgi:hypothetical protein